MALPLLSRAAIDDGIFVRLSARGTGVSMPPVESRDARARQRDVSRTLVPGRQPLPGEQYRFHIDMDACIGCKCCVVACNEQNGNPADINWRRVAEVEGGTYPAAKRAYVSMGCNHCADPTCLAGCPVDAYSKDAATGIVRHSADTCIGCQYCTWTCSYGVPQFNPERGVVGKCDMCHGRLALGQAPACVSACPEGALGIEIVNVAEWRARVADNNDVLVQPRSRAAVPPDAYPLSDGSLSTTRVTTPADLPAGTRPVNVDVVEPADPHWPLVAMTVLTQLAGGAFLTIALALAAGVSAEATRVPAAVSLGILGLGLAGSTLHLGRPIHAYRAMKMWRRSWLSREVVLFGAFAKAAAALVVVLWFGWPGATAAGAATAAIGLAGIAASAFIYQVPSRPLWHSSRTFVQFFATAALLGPLTAAALGLPGTSVWRAFAIVTALGQIAHVALVFRALAVSSSRELRGAHRLLRRQLRSTAVARVALLVIGGLLLPAASAHPVAIVVALVAALSGELAGRYLFFAAAVPRHMTAPYLAVDREAA